MEKVHIKTALLLALLSAAILLPWLGREGIETLQEARVAATAKTMLASGDYLVPRFAGQVRTQKPPLLYWMAAASMQLSGKGDELSARLPVALLSIVTIVALYLLAAPAVGSRAAFIAALTLLGGEEFLKHARSCRIDAVLVFWMLLSGMALFYGWQAGGRKRLWRWAGAFAATLGGVFAKGPAALVLPLLIMPLTLLLYGDFKALKNYALYALAGTAAVLGISAQWVEALNHYYPQTTRVLENEAEVLFSGRKHAQTPFYYFYQLFWSFAPASALLIPGAVFTWRGWKEAPIKGFCLVWFAALFVILSFIMQNRQPQYSLMLVVPFAILTGIFADAFLRADACLAAWMRGWTLYAVYALGLLAGLALPLWNLTASRGLGPNEPLPWAYAALIAAAGFGAVFFNFKKEYKRAFWMIFIIGSLAFAWGEGFVRPRGIADPSPRSFWAKAQAALHSVPELYVWEAMEGRLAFYVEQNTTTVKDEEELAAAVLRQGEVFLLACSSRGPLQFKVLDAAIVLSEKVSLSGRTYYLYRVANPTVSDSDA